MSNYEIIVGTKLDLDFCISNIDSVLIRDPSVTTNIEITAEDSFNFDPDGALWFLPKNLLNDFKEFYYDYFKNNSGQFNFTNGPFAESFAVFQMYEDKYIIVFLDPECGTGIFEDVVSQFSEIHNIDEMYGEECHIFSKLSSEPDDIEFLPEIFQKVIMERYVYITDYYYIFNNIQCKENDRIKYIMHSCVYYDKIFNNYILINNRFCGNTTSRSFDKIEDITEYLNTLKYLVPITNEQKNQWELTGVSQI